MQYAFIAEQSSHHSVRRICRILEVSHSVYYEWRDRPPSARALANENMQSEIVRIHEESRVRPMVDRPFMPNSSHLAFRSAKSALADL